jgi:hypothetical protein
MGGAASLLVGLSDPSAPPPLRCGADWRCPNSNRWQGGRSSRPVEDRGCCGVASLVRDGWLKGQPPNAEPAKDDLSRRAPLLTNGTDELSFAHSRAPVDPKPGGLAPQLGDGHRPGA